MVSFESEAQGNLQFLLLRAKLEKVQSVCPGLAASREKVPHTVEATSEYGGMQLLGCPSTLTHSEVNLGPAYWSGLKSD